MSTAPPAEPEAIPSEPSVEPERLEPGTDGERAFTTEPEAPLRLTLATLCTTLGAGILVGGVFTDFSARGYAVGLGILGGLLAHVCQRLRSAWATNVAIVGGLLLLGVLAGVAVGGPGALLNLRTNLAHALTEARLLRPPIELTSGFAFILGWIMAGVGFIAVWVATAFRRPIVGLLLPLLTAAVAAISVSKTEQAVDGLLVLVLFIVGLSVSSGGRAAEGRGALPIGYELRRAAKSLPIFVLVVVGLGVLIQLHAIDFLFPRPVVSPEYQAQRPKTVPLSAVQDRDLFDVQSSVSGPWLVGSLDVYDGHAWLLPPLADADLRSIPSNGVVDPALAGHTGIVATITIQGLTGAVLPDLPNTVGILASGPRLDYDARSGNIRLVEGEISKGFTYKVAAASVPTVQDLEKVNRWPSAYDEFTQIPAPGPAARGLLAQAPKSSKWDEWDYVRLKILNDVTASGPGTPVDISPDRVDQILQKKQGSPFEIVAMQAMFARWVGIPARIGYGFDGGTKVGGHLEVHPKDGAAFPEVYFPGSGWIPVIGRPAHAKADLNSNPALQQFVSGVQPSQDIAVQLILPVVLPAESTALETVRDALLTAAAALAAIGLLYLLYPLAVKSLARARRRAAARALGPRARIVQAYSEWRDLLTDYGYRHHSDSPLRLLDRFPEDDDHTELAWLVTRTLWGDLQDQISDTRATDAEELSSTLRRRLAQAHPITVRAVASLSRLSLREPYRAEPAPAAAPLRQEAMSAAV